MATNNKNFIVKNGLIVRDSTNLVNYSSASPSGNFLGQLWINEPYLYAWSSASTWVLIGDGNSGGGGGGGGTASGTPLNIPNTLIARSASGSFQIGSVDFHTASPVVSAIGRITWDDGEGTAALGLGGGNVNLKIGQEEVARCYNGTGSTISKGSVVYISGAQGQRPSISLSNASTEATSSKTFGIAAESIADGAEGLVCTFGIVEGINTSAFTEGSSLWLSASSGLMTNTIPVAPIHMVFVGYCIKSHATAGRIFVKPQNGYEIQELHNVLINGVNNTHILSYNSASSLWMNKDLQAAIKEVDGAGSGIDSDLLDGEQGSYYLDWTNTTNKPDPIIGVNLIGNTTGAASATLTDLTNGQISITTNTSHATTASSIAGSLVTGTVANATNASHASTASSINASLLTGTTLPAGIVGSSLTSVGTLTALTVSQSSGRVQFGTDAGGSISLGRIDNVASTPYIDFNSGASSVDFDVRIQVSGGNGIGSGNGTLAISASVVNVDSGTLVVDGTRNRVGIGTTVPNTALEVVSSNSNITARSTGESHQSIVAATDVNYFAGPTFRGTYITQFGASATGTLAGISTTSLGALAFQNTDNAVIYTNGSTPIIFATLSAERMRITSGGNIGIGTTNPNRTLSVIGSASFTGDISATTFSGLLLGNAMTASSINISGVTGLASNISTFLQTPTSANLAAAITDESGTAGAVAFTNNPTFTGTLNAQTIDATNGIRVEAYTQNNIDLRTDGGFFQTSIATTASGWPQTTNTWYHLISSTHSNTGNYYSMQFAGSFYDSNALFYRATNGSGATSWNQVWHSGNIAAASVSWGNISNKPDPIIGVNLIGEVTGAASATLTDLANGQISINTTIAADSVILGTDTTGNYVAGATGGNGIIVSGTPGEGWSPTLTVHSSALTASVSGTSPTAVGSNGFRNITVSTSTATGGSDGDVWLVYV